MILFYPYECNLIITLLEVYKEWRVFDGGTWGMLKIPEQRYGGHAHPQCISGHFFFTPRKIP